MPRPTTKSKIALLSAVSGAALLAMGQAHAQLGTPTILSGTGSTLATPDPDVGGRNLTQTITQTSSRLVVQWDNMDIASDQSVIFSQAAATNIAVNRITGGSVDGTTIDGILSANGRVWIIDPNGITFGANANVDVNGLLATTADFADITGDPIDFAAENNAFVLGGAVNLVFDVEGTAGATIDTTALAGSNADGGISAGAGGVKLIAEGINHQGLIEVTNPVGVVELVGAAGNGTEVFTLTVDASNGAGLVQVPVTTDAAAVEIAGQIAATGGTVRISAAGTAAAIENVVSAGTVIEADTITLQSDGTISLTNANNDFIGSVDAEATSVTLVDANSIELGDIDSGGGLNVTALAGSISDGLGQGAGGDIDVTGQTTLSANTSITLDDATNDFGGGVIASGTDLSFTDTNAILLADIDASGSLTVVSGGGINDGGVNAAGEDINVGTTTSLTATNAVNLNDTTHDFGGAVSATGSSVTLADANAIELADIDTAGTLTVSALGGAITDGAEAGADSDINAGAANFSATSVVTLDDQTHDFTGGVSASGTNITLTDANSINLADIDAGGTLTVSALSGSITDGGQGSAGDDINVAGATSLSATTTIVLNDQTHDFADAVDASGTAVTLADANSVTLGDIDTAGTLTVTAVTGSITDGAAAGAGLDITAGSANLIAGGNITINDATNVIGGSFAASGDNLFLDFAGTAPTLASLVAGTDLQLEVDGDLAGGPFNVTGNSTLTSTGGSISLTDSANNVFGGLVTASAEGAIDIRTDGALNVDATAEAAGGVDSSNTVLLDAGGLLTASALGNVITLGGSSVAVGTISALQDGANAGGNLTITADDAAGTVTGSSLVLVEGTSTLNGPGDVVLDNAGNDFVGDVDATTSAGGITLVDTSDLTIASLIIGTGTDNDLSLTAGGTLTTAAVITANDVTLSAADISANTINALNGGNLDFTTVGNIDNASATFNVTGDSTFTSTGGSILINDALGSFAGSITAIASDTDGSVVIDLAGDRTLSGRAGAAGSTTVDNTVDLNAGGTLTVIEASGNDVTLVGGSLLLGDLDVEGTLVATATTAITGTIDDGAETALNGDINVAGIATFNADSDIVLNDTTHDFIGQVTATSTGGAISVADANGLDLIARAGTLGSIAAGNTVDIVASGALIVTEAHGVSINANGGSVSLGQITAQQVLGAGGDLTVVAATGSIVDDAVSALDIEGDASFTATTDATSITIDNPLNVIGGDLTVDGHDVTLDFAGTPPSIASVVATGTLDLEADGDLSSGFLQVTETTSITSNGGSISFVDSINNSFGGLVTAIADGAIEVLSDLAMNVDATAQAAGGLTTGNSVTLNSGGVLTVSATGNALDLDGDQVMLDQINALETLGGDGGSLVVDATTTITDAIGGIVLAEGTTDLTAPDGIALDNAGHDFVGGVTAVAGSSTGFVTLVDANDLEVDLAVAGDINAQEAANVVDIEAGGALTVLFAQGRDILIEGASVILGTIETALDSGSAGGDLTITANTGSITDSAFGSLAVQGTTDLTAQDDITLTDAPTLVGDVTATSTDGGITIDAIGDLTIAALTGTAGSMTSDHVVDLTSTGNLVATQVRGNTVRLEGDNVDLGDVDALEDTLSAGGNLTVVANTGTITDSQAILAEGSSALSADGDIEINDAGSDFVGAVTADSANGSITLVDGNDLTATARAGTSGSVTTANTVTLIATDLLTAAETLGYTVDLTGGDVSLGDVNTEQDAGVTVGSGALTVVANTGSIDDDTAGDLTVAGDADFTATSPGSSIVIDGAGNTVGGTVTADGNDVTFNFAASQVMGAVRATGDLILSAVGSLSGGPLDVDGTTDLTSTTGSISFTDNANSFDGAVTADANGSIELDGGTSALLIDATSGGSTTLSGSSIELTAVQAGSLSVTADNDITGGSANVSGLTDLTSTSGTIDLAGNNFQGQVTATAASAAGSVTITDTASLDIIAAAGTSGALTAANVVDVTAVGQLTLEALGNTVTAMGGSVVLADIDALSDTGGNGGTLTVDAISGGVTDTGAVVASDTSVINADGSITLDNGSNDFGGLLTAVSTSGSVTAVDVNALSVTASGTSVTLSGTSVALSDIDATGTLSVTATSGDIDDGAVAGANGNVDAAGGARFAASGDVIVDNTTNNFGGAVSASGANVTLADADGLELADIDTAGTLNVTVASGSITDGSAVAVGDDVNVGGDASFTVAAPAAGSAITIDDATHVFGGTVTTSGFDITLAFNDAQALGTTTAAGDLDVTAAGDLSGGPLVVSGTSSLASTAGSVTFTDGGNDFGDTVTADATQDITLSAAGDLDVIANAGDVVDLSAGGALQVSSTGGTTTLEGNTINIVSATASSLDAMATGAITGGAAAVSGVTTLTSLTDAITLTGNGFVGRVTATAPGAISLEQSGDLSVEATGSDITLTSVGNLTTTATGTDVELNGDDVTIETVTASQSLTVVAADAITGGVVDVVTSTTLTAGGDIDLSSTANQFGSDLSATGDDISLATTGAFVLGAINASGDFTASTDGNISDGSTPVVVAGLTELTAGGSVILANTSNDFGGAVSASGTTIQLVDANSLVLGDINASETLTIVFDADRASAPDTNVQLTDSDGTTILVTGATDISTGLDANTSIINDAGGPSINLDNASHRFAGGLALRRIGGSAFVSETAAASSDALILRNLEVGEDLTIQTGRSIVLTGRLTPEANGVFGLDPRLNSGQSNAAVLAEQGTEGLDQASFHLFIPDGATWTFDTTAGGASAAGADIRFDRPIDSVGAQSLSVDDIAARQDNATATGSLSLSAGTDGEVRFRDFVGVNRPLGLVRVLSAGSAFIGSTSATSPVNEEDDAFLMARSANPVSNADLNLRDFFYAASLSFENVIGNAQVLVPDVHAENGFEFFGLNVTGGDGSFQGGSLDGRGISGFAFGGSPDFLEVFGGIAPSGGDIIRGASAGLVADGINISARTTFNGCQVGDTSTCINLDIPVVVTAPQNTVTVDTVGMDDPNDSNFLAFGNEQLWANPPTFFILAPLPAAATEE